MGGFIRVNGDKYCYPLTVNDLKSCTFPDIMETDIKDESEGDIIFKTITILQLGWFIIQCIVRRVQNVPLTELEVVTLAFVTLNCVVYGLWWHKPQNVQFAIRVLVIDFAKYEQQLHEKTVRDRFRQVMSAVMEEFDDRGG